MQRGEYRKVTKRFNQDRNRGDTPFTSLSSITKTRKQKANAVGQKLHKLNKTTSII
jgi:hypothetical protein